MSECPVCSAIILAEINRCSVCGWDLTPPPSERSSTEVQQEQTRLQWARQMWTRVQTPTGARAETGLIASLQSLQEQLQQAAVERAHLQSQLDWALYRLEQMNPEYIAQLLSRLEERLSALPEPAPVVSEVGMDYSILAKLLAAGSWRKADEHTWEILLQVAFREEEGWLRVEDIESFPCTDLRTIDQLWQYYSGGQFGLSVQYSLWEQSEGQYTTFCDWVGWRIKDNWRYYEDLNFSINAPLGHLPVLAWRRRACYGAGKYAAEECFSFLYNRLANCEIYQNLPA